MTLEHSEKIKNSVATTFLDKKINKDYCCYETYYEMKKCNPRCKSCIADLKNEL